MRKSFGVSLFLIAAFGTTALADPIEYTINFTPAPGDVAPTEGSFTYNAGASDPFSDFTVTWDGIAFDLTEYANNPVVSGSPNTLPSCLTGYSGASASFQLLSGACDSPGAGFATDWTANSLGVFEFVTGSATDELTVGGNFSVPPMPSLAATGQWTITPETSSVPEPSAIIPVMLLFAFLLRKRLNRRTA